MNLSGVRIFVADLAPARAFYAESLGLRLTGGDKDAGYCLFSSTGVRIVVEVVADATNPEDRALAGRFTGLSFEVKDIDGEYRRLQQIGVRFVGAPELQTWGGWLATFEDPSGNQLQLVQLPG